MHLFRFGPRGAERPAVQLPDGRRLDVSSFGTDFGPTFFAAEDSLPRLLAFVQQNAGGLPTVPADVRYGACVARPHKLLCIGLNYRDHARETNLPIPKEPILFAKATSAIVGPNDDLMLPKDSEKTDWEVELLVVIGKAARYVEPAEAMQHVAGYALHNDYSERYWQLERGGQWVKGKSFDTFAPLGPFFVPKDQVPDPQNLALWLSVNGRKHQDSNTREMVFGPAELVAYLSHCLTLEPGDCISTGTPAGVGLGYNPPVYLKAGDTVELGIAWLGTQRQRVVPFAMPETSPKATAQP